MSLQGFVSELEGALAEEPEPMASARSQASLPRTLPTGLCLVCVQGAGGTVAGLGSILILGDPQ